jgi:membrane protein YqaA with SNARE-associated domain
LKKILHLFLKYKIWLLAILKPLGFWGAGAISFLDAAAIPVPMDLIIAGYVWADKKHFYLYVLVAAIGSALGGLVPFLLGRAGGELFLMKRIDRARYEQMLDRFEKQEFLAMMIPSIMPRVIRYTVTAVLTIEYGPEIVDIAGRLATRHRFALAGGVIVVLGLLGYWVWRAIWKKRGKKDGAGTDTEWVSLRK